jgi:hypothetical protein
MERKKQRVGSSLIVGALLLAFAPGCSGSSHSDSSSDEFGTLNLPLLAVGPSGVEYRLRDAVFEIQHPYWYDNYGGEGNGNGSPNTITLNSEDDPDASSLSVSVENGYYEVTLKPGWRMEQLDSGTATTVEATLLSDATQWVYVSPHSTSWAEFQFGIGSKEVWLNGKLNIEVQVYEDPDQYYGGYGYGGENGAGGDYGGYAGAGE